jgi:hypothetical protein
LATASLLKACTQAEKPEASLPQGAASAGAGAVIAMPTQMAMAAEQDFNRLRIMRWSPVLQDDDARMTTLRPRCRGTILPYASQTLNIGTLQRQRPALLFRKQASRFCREFQSIRQQPACAA